MSRIEIAQISVEFSSSRQTGSSVNSCPQLTEEWPLSRANCDWLRNALSSM